MNVAGVIFSLGAIALGTSPLHAADIDAVCSTIEDARTVITSTSGSGLVLAVAQSVPLDTPNCVPAYCAASADQNNNTKVAVGAGISEAYSSLIASGRDDEAVNLLGGACSETCDQVVVTAFAASQATTVSRLCETAFGGRGQSGSLPGGLVIDNGASGGGGQAASGS